MSESAEELARAAEALAELLTQLSAHASRLAEWTTELSQEAAAHGWGGVARRMREGAEALEATTARLAKGRQACQSGAAELGLINEEGSAEQVAGHLSASSALLSEAGAEVQEALAKIDQALTAVTEVGQRGMMAAASDLHGQVSDLHGRLLQLSGSSESEQAGAAAFATGQTGIPGSAVESAPEERTSDRWSDPQARRDWVEQKLHDPDDSKPVSGTAPWARYQRQIVGDREVRIGVRGVHGKGDRIWADGLQVDPDTVVAVEVKYISKPGRSLYEGGAPAFLEDDLLSDFDSEMERYALAIRDGGNPIGRLRIVASTQTAADFLVTRARRLLGQSIDIQARFVPREDNNE